MKKIAFIIIAFLIAPSLSKAVNLPVEITAESAIVANLDEDMIIYEKSQDEIKIMASLTKIMTTYTAINKIENLEEQITITQEDINNLNGYSSMGLKVGDAVTYKDLLYGIMIKSAADASQTVANHLAGNNDEFVKNMNENVQKLELTKTNFVDSYGGSNENVSTAKEMYIILKEALKNETFYEIFTTTSYTTSNGVIIKNNLKEQVYSYNLNPNMITGSKVGYTNDAGLLLATLSNIKGNNYVVITCKSAIDSKHSNHLFDTYKILNHLYENNYEIRILFEQGKAIKKIEVEDGQASEYVVVADKTITKILNDTEFNNLQYDYHITNIITPENKKGENLGYVNVFLGEELIIKYDVYLTSDISEYKETSNALLILTIILIIIAILLFCTNIMHTKKYLKKQ